jgi:hypothetical protein
MDLLVCDYIEWAWEEGLPRGAAGNLLSGMQHKAPVLKKRLQEAWRCYSSWCKREIARRASPLSREVLVAAAGWCWKHGDESMGLSLLVSFQGLLRTGELFDLQRQHITFSPDNTSAVLSLGYTKSGKRKGEKEYVTIDDARLVRLLALHLRDKEDHYLLIGRAPHVWRRDFEKVFKCFDIHKAAQYKPYSLRRGGATYLYGVHKNLSVVTSRGRWASVPTARLYIDEATEELNRYKLSEADRAFIAKHKVCVPP